MKFPHRFREATLIRSELIYHLRVHLSPFLPPLRSLKEIVSMFSLRKTFLRLLSDDKYVSQF